MKWGVSPEGRWYWPDGWKIPDSKEAQHQIICDTISQIMKTTSHTIARMETDVCIVGMPHTRRALKIVYS